MIGFKAPGQETAPQELSPTEDMLVQLFDNIMNPPDWQEAFDQTLFWALVFNTQDKVHKC